MSGRFILRMGLAVAALLAVALAGAAFWLVPSERDIEPNNAIAAASFERVGLPFVHVWEKTSTHPLAASAAIDVDGDGDDEVFLGGSDGQADALLDWRDGTIVDLAASMELGDTIATYGALSFDIDDDADVDLLTAGNAGVTLWINQGARFEARNVEFSLPTDSVAVDLAAADYDRDGDIDLYVSVFVDPANFRSPVFNDAAHAKRNVLLRNDGDFTFTDVTDDIAGGLQNTFVSSFTDLDNDGLPDLVLAQNTGQLELLRNLGGGQFERASYQSGYGFWMGLAVFDADGDGDQDLFLSNIGNSIPPLFLNGDRRDDQPADNEWVLLRNDGGFEFTEITQEAALTGFGFAWGASAADVNFDGKLDLMVAQNYAKWPIHRFAKLPGKVLLGSDGGFVQSEAAANAAYGIAPLLVDVDGDGRLDLVWVNIDGEPVLYRNRSERDFLSVRLPDAAASIGAKIRIGDGPIFEHIVGQGLGSDMSTMVSLGLPDGATSLPPITVEWASDQRSVLEPEARNTVLRASPPSQ
ncbi:MAG: VCBS repeat-containing protein [Ahrensia sp.]|nr:VCBS repeat-containing protein [Ahrensia sp.]